MSLTEEPERSIQVFYTYAQQDETLRDEVEKQLSILKWQGIITEWYDQKIFAGGERELEINAYLNTAHIILLLVSADFLASPYCYSLMRRAMERHESKEACVIPVLLRPVDWENAPFSKLQVLPTNSIPITSWHNRDEALVDVTKGIRKVAEELITTWGSRTRLVSLSGYYERNQMLQLSSSEQLHLIYLETHRISQKTSLLLQEIRGTHLLLQKINEALEVFTREDYPKE